MATEKDLDIPTVVNSPAVPQQDNLASEMAEELAEKRDDEHTEGLLQMRSPAVPPPRQRHWLTVSSRKGGHSLIAQRREARRAFAAMRSAAPNPSVKRR
jgi:hypothetical protein